MNIVVFDPAGPKRHQYVTEMYFNPLRQFLMDRGVLCPFVESIASAVNSTVIINADHLTRDVIAGLRDNGNRIVGFSCTDSSYVSQACRSGLDLEHIHLLFAFTGLQTVNEGREMVMTPDFKIALEKRQFLPDEDWAVFDSMRKAGRIQSIPYCHWERQPSITPKPYAERSQKALIRGGHHMRRFLLCLELMKHDLLDVNSGFYTAPYFQDDMNPQFRYCEDCRKSFSGHGYYPNGGGARSSCTNPHSRALNVSNLGEWNNRCPQSFYRLAQQLGANPKAVETLMNGKWLRQEDHLAMLSRITFTSDLKWLFSIYAAQRFWDAAMSGCVNVLPSRTSDQEYFPAMKPGEHYLMYDEDFKDLNVAFEIDEIDYLAISSNAFAMYQQYMKPDKYAIGTPILQRIWEKIQEHCS